MLKYKSSLNMNWITVCTFKINVSYFKCKTYKLFLITSSKFNSETPPICIPLGSGRNTLPWVTL